jgi:hypothetical protein
MPLKKFANRTRCRSRRLDTAYRNAENAAKRNKRHTLQRSGFPAPPVASASRAEVLPLTLPSEEQVRTVNDITFDSANTFYSSDPCRH